MGSLCFCLNTVIKPRRIFSKCEYKSVLISLGNFIFLGTLFMVVGRLLSGVHWLSDILGGLLLSTGLVMLYQTVVEIHKTL